MPTVKKPKKTAAAKKLSVVLSDRERLKLGKELLGYKDLAERSDKLDELVSLLGVGASELGNLDNVLLRSDFVAGTASLARATKKFETALRATDTNVIALAGFGHVDWDALTVQLAAIEKFEQWVRKEPSMKGGERHAYEKIRRRGWEELLFDWFMKHQKVRKGRKLKSDAKQFVLITMEAIGLAVEKARGALNTGKK